MAKVQNWEHAEFESSGGPPDRDIMGGAIRQATFEMRKVGQNIGQAVTNVGTTLRDFEEAKEKKDSIARNTRLGELMLTHEKEFLSFKQEYDREPHDPDSLPKDLEYQFDQIVGNLSKDINDQILKQGFVQSMNQRKMQMLGRAFQESRNRWVEQGKASILTQVEEFKKLGIEAGDEVAALEYKGLMTSVIRGSRGGVLSDDQAVKFEQDNLEEFDKKRKEFLIDKIHSDIARDPMAVSIALSSGFGYSELKDETARLKLTEAAERAIKIRASEAERDIKINHDREERELFGLLLKGELTDDEILKRKFISGDEQYAWFVRREAQAKGENVVTDLKTYMEIREDIVNEEPYEDVKKKILENVSKLSAQHRLSLFGELSKDVDASTKEGLKRGYEILKSSIIGKPSKMEEIRAMSSGERIPVKEEDLKRYYNAVNDLDEQVRQARKKKPLTSREIVDRAMEIVGKLPKKTATDFLEDIPSTEKPIEPKGPKRNPGETAQQYLDRIGAM